jgi:hypothetical protein
MSVQNPKKWRESASRNTPPMRAPSTPAEDLGDSTNAMTTTARNTRGG